MNKNLNIVKEGNKYTYTCLNGDQIKHFEKAWNRNEDGCLDVVMDEFFKQMEKRGLNTKDDREDEQEIPSSQQKQILMEESD